MRIKIILMVMMMIKVKNMAMVKYDNDGEATVIALRIAGGRHSMMVILMGLSPVTVMTI